MPESSYVVRFLTPTKNIQIYEIRSTVETAKGPMVPRLLHDAEASKTMYAKRNSPELCRCASSDVRAQGAKSASLGPADGVGFRRVLSM